MNRIESTFAKLKKEGKKAFIAYAMAGYPDFEKSMELAQGLLASGADLLEVGVPFSDPLADGPVIQRAAETALAQGASLQRGLEMASALRAKTDKPLLIMTYYNPVLHMGLEAFGAAASASGVDGMIVPDLPPEEAQVFLPVCKKHGLCLILLAAPTSTPARLKKIAAMASGFIYFVSVTGVTGEHKTFDSHLGPAIKALRQFTKLPLAIGFGVSDAAKAAEAAGQAEAVVVASAVLKPFQDKTGAPAMAAALDKARELIGAVRNQ